jgi:hypothetical protein
MDAKEEKWLKERIGFISASEVDKLMSKSGKWTRENITYLYKIQRQRFLKEPAPPVFSKIMQIGTENEPYAVEWIRVNMGWIVVHCDKDLSEKVFVKTDWGLGSSPDVYKLGIQEIKSELGNILCRKEIINSLIEIKCVVGEETTNYYFSPTVPFKKKRLRAFDEHIDQMAAQLLTHPSIDTVYLMKYDPQDDENPWDLRPVLDKTRGLLFEFSREEFGSYLDEMKERVTFANDYLNSGKDLDDIQNCWDLYIKQNKENGTKTS